MSDDVYDTLVSRIQTNHRKAERIGQQSNRVSWWDVGYGFDTFRAGYDKKSRLIFTFLPPDSYPGGMEDPDDYISEEMEELQ